MIDTHAHIDTDAFDHDLPGVLERAWSSGVENIIIPGIDPDGFDKIISIVNESERIYFGVGIHPHNALQAGEVKYAQIQSHETHKKLVAIG